MNPDPRVEVLKEPCNGVKLCVLTAPVISVSELVQDEQQLQWQIRKHVWASHSFQHVVATQPHPQSKRTFKYSL